MTENFLTENGLCAEKLPTHVAIIMDGNGRWAKKRLWNRLQGHRAGMNSVDKITMFCRQAGIKYLTLYAFSTENWKRPEDEVHGLLSLLREYLKKKRAVFLENNVRLKVIGDLSKFPEDILSTINFLGQETADNNPVMTLTLALSYGSRFEIIDAVKKISHNVATGKIILSEINEKMFSDFLYTFDTPDPDFVIRTSGEIRLSNYLLWQTAYSELYFTDVLWPDFKEKEFVDALKDYADRERRFGKTAEQIKERK